MTPLPREPVGEQPIVQTVRQIIRRLRELQIISDPTVRVTRTVEGTRITVIKQPSASAGSGGSGGGNVPRWG